MCSYRQASLCIDYMLRHITDIHDRGSMFELRLQAKAQFDMKGSVEGAFAGIAELGIELIPDMPAGLLLWVEAYPDLTDPSTYKQHPVFAMQNTMQPLEAYAMAIMSSATPTMFYLGDARWTGVTNTMMELTRKRGLSPEGAYSFCLFSLQMWPLAKMAQQFATAETSLLMIRETGELGRRMIPRINTAVCLACLPSVTDAMACDSGGDQGVVSHV
jgi:hypothetical protein